MFIERERETERGRETDVILHMHIGSVHVAINQ